MSSGLTAVAYRVGIGLLLALIGTTGVFVWLRVSRFTAVTEADPRGHPS